ncbi:hypothetical protein [Tatumella sp. UBA2305]|uniref:hypothetical protein n=1 Tax=Tatumella sp. UBA2305 TaxID=1947647 RepID=UPI0025F086AC|nr:hypothetical protein [Tatumella sp. UBA2305]
MTTIKLAGRMMGDVVTCDRLSGSSVSNAKNGIKRHLVSLLNFRYDYLFTTSSGL